MKFLLQHGADINETNYNGESGLILAAKKGHFDVVKFLVEKGANLSKGKSQYNALYHAVENGHTEIVKFLLEQEIDPSGALVIAAEKGYEEILKTLLDHGGDINETNNKYTPLTCAVVRGGLNIVQILIDRGADVNRPDGNGKKALQYAREYEDKEIADILIKAGAEN